MLSGNRGDDPDPASHGLPAGRGLRPDNRIDRRDRYAVGLPPCSSQDGASRKTSRRLARYGSTRDCRTVLATRPRSSALQPIGVVRAFQPSARPSVQGFELWPAIRYVCERVGVPTWSPGQPRHNAAERVQRLYVESDEHPELAKSRARVTLEDEDHARLRRTRHTRSTPRDGANGLNPTASLTAPHRTTS